MITSSQRTQLNYLDRCIIRRKQELSDMGLSHLISKDYVIGGYTNRLDNFIMYLLHIGALKWTFE